VSSHPSLGLRFEFQTVVLLLHYRSSFITDAEHHIGDERHHGSEYEWRDVPKPFPAPTCDQAGGQGCESESDQFGGFCGERT
jgi:hypothetical protein